MRHARDALCVALDHSQREWIVATAKELSQLTGWLKLGLEAFTGHGPDLVAEVASQGCRVFLDVKLHDIPNTVGRAAANCATCGAHMFNVHAAGGATMLRAAAEGARSSDASPPPKVLAVTVLTSLDSATFAELGLETTPDALVLRWARLAQDCGLDGVVASAQEAPAIRAACGPEFLIVTPGIRPQSSAHDDQRRVVTPRQAIAAGADILVVGRPITGAQDPAAETRRLVDDIELAVRAG
jgi:orotidine-5'-phosphate decarboxylase